MKRKIGEVYIHNREVLIEKFNVLIPKKHFIIDCLNGCDICFEDNDKNLYYYYMKEGELMFDKSEHFRELFVNFPKVWQPLNLDWVNSSFLIRNTLKRHLKLSSDFFVKHYHTAKTL